jgi:putative selenium metabolism hydrolase
MSLDERILELAAKYRPLAVEILKEVIRIPADYVDRGPEEGGDPLCGLSNHEGPRLEYLKSTIVEHGAVANAADVDYDAYGNLVWTVQDPDDGVAPADKTVVYFDGHTDTVKALRDQWTAKVGPGMDAYNGLTDLEKVNRDFLRSELGYLPPDEEWDNLVFGRGAADQLSGVVSQVIATKIMLELKGEGALQGVIVRSYATTAEEDNDGAGPMHLVREVLPGAGPELVPDAVVLTEGTGDRDKGAVGIYRGQRGRMQIEVEVIGRSCHGSMPWEGLNPLEFGARILCEAADAYDARENFLDDAFLGHGTRTASWATLESPSDCAVPDKFTFRFDRRLTVGEDPAEATATVEALPAVAKAREAGLTVNVRVPTYDQPTWKGYSPNNPQIYMGWVTPEEHPAIQAAVDTYGRVITPGVEEHPAEAQAAGGHLTGSRRRDARVDRWIFSTDGVGFPVPVEGSGINVENKRWVTAGKFMHPPMFGCGPGIEQNTHKIGECVDARELQSACAFLSRFPSRLAELRG